MQTPTFQTLITATQLGHMLKSARKRQKLTQRAVAVRLGLSQNRVSYLETHPEELSFRQLLAWCAVVKLELKLGERQVPETEEKPEW